MAVFRVVASNVIALMLGASSISETSVNVYQTARRNNLEDSHRLVSTKTKCHLKEPTLCNRQFNRIICI